MDGAWDSEKEGIHMRAELLRKTTCSDLIRKLILPSFKLNSCKCNYFFMVKCNDIYIYVHVNMYNVHVYFIY